MKMVLSEPIPSGQEYNIERETREPACQIEEVKSQE